MDARPTLRARLDLAGAAALFSTGGVLIKSIDLTAWQVACLRSLVASAALALFLFTGAAGSGARHLRSARAWLVGLGFAVTMILFVQANKHTTALNAIYLQSTAPIHVVWLAPLLLREWVRRRDLVFMAVLATGMALFFVGQETAVASAPDPARGNLLAAISGVTWAFTIVGLRGLGRGADPSATAAAVTTGSVLAAALALPFALPLPVPAASDVAALLFLGLFQIALAYVLLNRGIRGVPAFEASLLLLVEPILNPIWTFLVHGERPSIGAAAGSAVILVATGAKAWLEARIVARPAAGERLP